ncbi:MAG: RNA polymerase sigma factor [Gemmatimonadaceae bacterium]
MITFPVTPTPTIPFPSSESGVALNAVRRAQGGDVGAFEEIYREHSPRVYALCLRLSGNSGMDATELMQDVFIRAWNGLGTFRGDCAFSSWLHRLAVNVMLETARGDGRRMARVVTMEEPDTVGAMSAPVTPDLRMDLENAIAGLPPGARTAFVLHDIEGYKHEEIAEQLGVAVGTVKAQLHRARKLLIKALDR